MNEFNVQCQEIFPSIYCKMVASCSLVLDLHATLLASTQPSLVIYMGQTLPVGKLKPCQYSSVNHQNHDDGAVPCLTDPVHGLQLQIFDANLKHSEGGGYCPPRTVNTRALLIHYARDFFLRSLSFFKKNCILRN